MSFHRLLARVLLVTTTFAMPFFPIRNVRAAPPIVFGEIAWAGSSLSTSDEWIELWNLGDEPVALANYAVEGGSGTPIILPEDAVIAPKSTYLISNYVASDPKSVLASEPQLVMTAVSLSNSSLHLVLRTPDGTELDQVGDGGAPAAGASGASGATKTSMVRIGEEWVSATTSLNLKPDVPDLGTPGICDGCSNEPSPSEIPTEPPPTEDPLPEASPTSTETLPDMNPTSTDPLPEDLTTSTELEANPLPTETGTSTDAEPTEPETPEYIPEPEPETVTSTPELPVIDTTPASTESEPATSIVDTVPHYAFLRLNEVMAAPTEGQEWVEITNINPTTSVSLVGVELRDATGKIFTFATGTLDGMTPFVRAVLSSAKLNNSGDSVILVDPTGNILESFTYEGTTAGSTWAKAVDGTGTWTLTPTPTPDAPNSVPVAEPEPQATPTVPSSSSGGGSSSGSIAATAATSTKTATTTSTVKTPATSSVTKSSTATTTPITSTAKKPESSTQKATTSKATSTKATTSKKTSTKTTAAKAAPIPLTHDMANLEENAGIPVILNGRVGTQPGLLSGHYFILLAPDGRGIRVRLPTSRKLPEFGTYVSVVGVITFDEKGIPTVGVRKDDPVEAKTDASVADPEPRLVNLFSPAAEDSWSFVHVTGTVLSVKGSTVVLDLKDMEIDVVIKTITGYRTSRLTVGDTVTVRGVLENTGDEYRILPRTTDDIAITANAPIAAAKTDKTALPGWMPFGAAAAAIAGTEGTKKLRERHKQRKLEKILETDPNI